MNPQILTIRIMVLRALRRRLPAALMISGTLGNGATPVLTRSYDNGRTGANTSETILTPAVVSQGLRKLFSLRITDDPRIEAQPLYVPGLTMSDGQKHDVVYVFSMANTVWAFDANTGKQIWSKPVSLGPAFRPKVNTQPGQHRSTEIDSWGINILWGILSTPVIDLDTHMMYIAHWTIDSNKNRLLRLHGLKLEDGSEPRPAVPIQASTTNSAGKTIVLGQGQKQRAALLLAPLQGSLGPGAPKTLFVAFTGGENPGAPHGWVVAFDVDAFEQTAAWVATPSSFGGGIWQGAQGPAADENGNVYIMTANGGFIENGGTITDFDGTTDFAESFVKLHYTPGSATGGAALTTLDWFSPFKDSQRGNVGGYDYRDQDLGSAGPVVPPGTNLVLGAGKDGVLYVLDRNNMGKAVGDFTKLKAPPIFFTWFPGFGVPATGNLDFDLKPGMKTHHLHGSPVYWNGPDRGAMLFDWGENEYLRAWTLDTNTGVATFLAKGAELASAALADPNRSGLGGMPGAFLTLSANGNQKSTGIVWTTAPIDGDANHEVVEGIVRAYDAATLDANNNTDGTQRLKLLWTSKMIPGSTFRFSKFCPPFVADGKLFVTTYVGRIDVYGPK
jgi:outer membrane protein assembly factor BamB